MTSVFSSNQVQSLELESKNKESSCKLGTKVVARSKDRSKIQSRTNNFSKTLQYIAVHSILIGCFRQEIFLVKIFTLRWLYMEDHSQGEEMQ